MAFPIPEEAPVTMAVFVISFPFPDLPFDLFVQDHRTVAHKHDLHFAVDFIRLGGRAERKKDELLSLGSIQEDLDLLRVDAVIGDRVIHISVYYAGTDDPAFFDRKVTQECADPDDDGDDADQNERNEEEYNIPGCKSGCQEDDQHGKRNTQEDASEHKGKSDVPETELAVFALYKRILGSQISGRDFTDICAAELADFGEKPRAALGAVSYLFRSLQMWIVDTYIWYRRERFGKRKLK